MSVFFTWFLGVSAFCSNHPVLILTTVIAAYLITKLIKVLLFWNGLPGPWGLPFVGYLPFLTDAWHEDFAQLAKKYGPAVQIKIGNKNVIALNSNRVIQEAYKRLDFSGRPHVPTVVGFQRSKENTIIFVEGDRWSLGRKIAKRALNVFQASRKSKLEAIILARSQGLKETISENLGHPIDFRPLAVSVMASIISSACFGTPIEFNDPCLQPLVTWSVDFSPRFLDIALVDYFPVLKLFKGRQINAYHKLIDDFADQVYRYIMAYTPDRDNIATIADALHEATLEICETEKKKCNMTDVDIRCIAIDLYDAGFFVSTENIEYILLLFATYPHVQKRVQKELDDVIGKRQVFLADEAKLPYTRATIYEGLRFASNTALTIPHRVTDDTEFLGCKIKKDTIVFANQWAVNYDPEIFPAPEEYRPERFLDMNGAYDVNVERKCQIFGAGKRICPGEDMARLVMFLVTATILQDFFIKVDPETKGNPLKGVPNLTKPVGPHKLIFEKR